MDHVESLIQVAPDSTGKKLRTFQIRTVLDDGTPATVEIQAACIVGADGKVLDLVDAEWKDEVLTELKTIRATLWEMLGRMVPPGASLRS